MHRQTRKRILNIATGVAVAAAAAVVFLPAAQAAPGTITANVNVRSGPGTGYGVVDVAKRGQQVDVQKCQGSWCYVVKPGPDGWVSASYLTASGGAPVNPSNPNLSFGFTIGGPNGPQISIGVGNGNTGIVPPPPGPGPRPPVVQPSAQACFFERVRFGGQSFCMRPGESIPNLGDWSDTISSIQNPQGLEVQVCTDSGYRNCRTYTTSASSLNDYDDYIVSVRVR